MANPTLSATLILQATLAAFRTLYPFVGRLGTDFSDQPLRLNDLTIAHIRSLPGIASYDSVTGYANGATEGRELLTDIPIRVDSHKHVPLKFSHLNLIKDQKEVYQGAIGDTAYVIGKAMTDSWVGKCNGANLSYSATETTANSDLDVIEAITSAMNTNGASPTGRIGLISTEVAQTLALDSRIASRDFYGTLTGGSGLRVFRNVGGFEALYEYPALTGNNGTSQVFTAATTDIITSAAHGRVTGERVRLTTTTTLPAGLSLATTYYVIRIDADTFKLASSAANALAGTAVDITDTGTGVHTVSGYENITGIFLTAAAVAIRAGIPEQTAELAQILGIPQVMQMDRMRDPINGFALALMKWQQGGTGDLYVSPTAIWGSSVGRQSGAAGSLTDKAGYLLRSA